MHEIRNLAQFIVSLDNSKIPQNVLDTASRCVFDTVSCGIGASEMRQMIDIRKVICQDTKSHDVAIWGSGEKASPACAAFLNAMSSHLLELDDVHTKSKTHIGTVVIPSAYSMAVRQNASGQDFLCSVVCGYETASRIGMALNVVEHRTRGWHSTATAGVFGAAAACAKLMNLNVEQTISALGMAGMQASGLWAFLEDGASCKVLNPARAAVNGYVAALLASAGMTGPEHILTAKDGGLLNAMSDGGDSSKVDRALGEVWEIMYMDNKPYPCCRSTHPSIDAAIHIHNQYHFPIEDIKSIEVETYAIGKKQCGETPGSLHPSSVSEAKFSIPYTVIAALIKGCIGLSDFTLERITDEKIQRLLPLVTVNVSDRYTQAYPLHWSSKLIVDISGHGTIEYEVIDPLGSPYNPLTNDEVIKKGRDLISKTYNHDDTESVISALSNLKAQKTVPIF